MIIIVITHCVQWIIFYHEIVWRHTHTRTTVCGFKVYFVKYRIITEKRNCVLLSCACGSKDSSPKSGTNWFASRLQVFICCLKVLKSLLNSLKNGHSLKFLKSWPTFSVLVFLLIKDTSYTKNNLRSTLKLYLNVFLWSAHSYLRLSGGGPWIASTQWSIKFSLIANWSTHLTCGLILNNEDNNISRPFLL